MTSKERMLEAIWNRQPDMVPVAPDISNMIPCRLTGKPFVEIYRHQDPPLWKAYLQAMDYFGFDGWFIYGSFDFKLPHSGRSDVVNLRQDSEFVIDRHKTTLPAGEYYSTVTYYPADPPTVTEKPVKDFQRDFAYLKHFYQEPLSCDFAEFEVQRKALGERGVLGTSVDFPGLHILCTLIQGGLEAATYAYYDYPDLFEELRELHHRSSLRRTEMILDAKPDFILVGSSGTITMQSPDIFRHLGLPTLKGITKLCRQAGIPSMLHSCGKESELVKICAEETDLNCINPLEIPPMGDCNLKELKILYGGKLSLMGNLHTTEIMLKGTPADVRRAAMQAIDDAGKGGGFILSTGDQCGRDTPDDNIREMIKTARTYGKY